MPNYSPGASIASLLNRAWRNDPEPVSISAREISTIAPLLLRTGSAAFAWRRLQSADVLTEGSSSDLRDAYRRQSIEAAVHEVNVRDIFIRARATGVEPILFKGWALARMYPDDGLRPYGDIDLWVRPEDLEKLYAAMPTTRERSYCVEPHVGFYPQYERSFADVRSRTQLVPLDNIQVRVPCDEDHLRFICLHFLYHGAWRPLWLCDVALMIESRRENFDWDRCLAGKKKYADWVACVIGLANQLLGADISGTPVEKRAAELPRWLPSVVLRQWEKGLGMSRAESLSFSFPRNLLKPTQMFKALQEHWRNPIQASVEMNAKFNDTPRTIFQLGAALSRLPDFTKHFGAEIRRT